jgi:hypothetical protein
MSWRRSRRERLVELVERGPAPEREGLTQHLSGLRGGSAGERRPALLAQPVEADEVERLGADLERVARAAGDERAGGQHLAQPRDVDLDHLGRRRRCVMAPQVLDETVDRDRTVGVEQQASQQRPPARRPEGNRHVVDSSSSGPSSRAFMPARRPSPRRR